MAAVPLKNVVDLVVEGAYAQLLGLQKKSTTTSSAAKRRDLSDFCKLMTNAFQKVLALIRWSKEITATTAVDQLREYMFQVDCAVCQVANALETFQHTNAELATVRVPQYDVASAAMVLSTGTYDFLPSTLAEPARAAAAAAAKDEGAAEPQAQSEQVDYVLNARLRTKGAAAKIIARLRRWDSSGARSTLRVAGGLVHLKVPGQFYLGLTLRNGQWIIMPQWTRIYVQVAEVQHGGVQDRSASKQSTEAVTPRDVGRLSYELQLRFDRGASISAVLDMVHQFCLRLQLDILRSQAVSLQSDASSRSRTTVAAQTETANGLQPSLCVSYWAAPSEDQAATVQVAIRSHSIEISHTPPLVLAGADQLILAECNAMDSEAVNFQQLLFATMSVRAALRIQTLHRSLKGGLPAGDSAPGTETSAESIVVANIAPSPDVTGFSYLEVKVADCKFELHIRQGDGLLFLHETDGWFGAESLKRWQAQLDLGSGVLECESVLAILKEIQKVALLGKFVAQAAFHGLHTVHPSFEITEPQLSQMVTDFVARGPFKAFLQVPNAYISPKKATGEQFCLSVEVDDDCQLCISLAEIVPTISVLVPLYKFVGLLDIADFFHEFSGGASSTGQPVGQPEAKRQRSAEGFGPSTTARTTAPRAAVGIPCAKAIPELIDALCKRIIRTITFSRLLRILQSVGLEHAVISNTRIGLVLPDDGQNPLKIRTASLLVLDDNEWECQCTLTHATAAPIARHMQQCLGDAAKVGDCVLIQLKDQQDMCIRYFGIDDSSVTQLRHDICRLGHMITLIDQIRRAEQETESGPACIRRICSTSLSHVSFCCADKDNTTIRLELLPRQTGLRVSVSPQPPSIHLLIANFFPAGMYHFEGHGKKICFPPTATGNQTAAANLAAKSPTRVAKVVECVYYVANYHATLSVIYGQFQKANTCEVVPRSLTTMRLIYRERLAVDCRIDGTDITLTDVASDTRLFKFPGMQQASRLSALPLFTTITKECQQKLARHLSSNAASDAPDYWAEDFEGAMLFLHDYLADCYAFYSVLDEVNETPYKNDLKLNIDCMNTETLYTAGIAKTMLQGTDPNEPFIENSTFYVSLIVTPAEPGDASSVPRSFIYLQVNPNVVAELQKQVAEANVQKLEKIFDDMVSTTCRVHLQRERVSSFVAFLHLQPEFMEMFLSCLEFAESSVNITLAHTLVGYTKAGERLAQAAFQHDRHGTTDGCFRFVLCVSDGQLPGCRAVSVPLELVYRSQNLDIKDWAPTHRLAAGLPILRPFCRFRPQDGDNMPKWTSLNAVVQSASPRDDVTNVVKQAVDLIVSAFKTGAI